MKNQSLVELIQPPKQSLLQTLTDEVKKLNIKVAFTTPADQENDGVIQFAGLFSTYHISVGEGYYAVVRILKNGTFLFIDGEGDLENEINKARRHNPRG